MLQWNKVHISPFVIMSLLVAVAVTGSLSDNLAFAQKDKGGDQTFKVLEDLVNDLIATVENLSNAVAQLQADVTELKNNGGGESSVSPVYVNSEIITTAASDVSTYNISCNAGDVAQSGSLTRLDNPKKFLQVYYDYSNEEGSWEFQISNEHPAQSLDAKLSITCLRAQ